MPPQWVIQFFNQTAHGQFFEAAWTVAKTFFPIDLLFAGMYIVVLGIMYERGGIEGAAAATIILALLAAFLPLIYQVKVFASLIGLLGLIALFYKMRVKK